MGTSTPGDAVYTSQLDSKLTFLFSFVKTNTGLRILVFPAPAAVQGMSEEAS